MLDLTSSKFSEKNSLYPYAAGLTPEMIAAAKKQMAPWIMEEIVNRSQGIVADPDTEGADFFCLLNFRTPEMTEDFVAIEQDFMKHCGNRLQELNDVAWYDTAYFGVTKPADIMYSHVLRLIYNGAKNGDEYCVELLKNLYKTYHKKEYNQLKRFRTLSPEDAVNISDDFKDENEDCVIGRIMSMAPFFGIELSVDFVIFYKALADKMEAYCNIVEKTVENKEVKEEVIRSSAQIVDKWLSESDKDKSLIKGYRELTEFADFAFRDQGAEGQYDKLCMDHFPGGRHQLIMTLSLLRTMNPKREYIFGEVLICSRVRDLVIALTDVASSVDTETSFLLGERLDEAYLKDVKFKNITVADTKDKADKRPHVEIKTTIKTGDETSKEDYLKEIEELRTNLKRCKQDVSLLKTENGKLKKDLQNSNCLLDQYESERDELIRLREFAFHSTNEEDLPAEENREAMETAIAKKQILIIGGHPNWHRKIGEKFPNWKCIQIEKFASLDPKMVDSYDGVYFFTSFISHTEYYKFVSYMNRNNIRYGYIGNINIESMIRDVYNDLRQ